MQNASIPDYLSNRNVPKWRRWQWDLTEVEKSEENYAKMEKHD